MLSVVVLTVAYAAHAAEVSRDSEGYKITGIVVSSVDGSPVPHAHLSAGPSVSGRGEMIRNFRGERNPSGIGTDADEHGRFTLPVASAGRWRLTASANGFVTQAYDEHDSFSAAVVLTSHERTVDLHFRISPEAEITGTVLDEAGEPVRDARMVLQHRPAVSPGQDQEEFRNRMVVQTDDRGVFDFSGLAEGDYRVMADAKPWYSTAGQPRLSSGSGAASDSALDVTYQLTWFPGVDDAAQAEILSLHPADSERADFHLVPIPAAHIRFSSPLAAGPPQRRAGSLFPILERVDTSGSGVGTMATRAGGFGSAGQFDLGDLAPGLYRLRVPGSDQNAQIKLIEITPGSSRVLDSTVSGIQLADITLESPSSGEEDLQRVVLKNVETGARFRPWRANEFIRARAGNSDSESKVPEGITIQVPPGRYEVSLAAQDTYLVGMAARGADVAGRFIVVHPGEVKLTLRMAKGRAAVSGLATANGKPVEGAMVVLVPAGLKDPSSFTSVVRDETNTDGSFDLNDVIPGQYILIAVDRGWQVNWKDGAALEKYLMQGVPLDLRTDVRVKQEIVVQEP
jgi:hypothetical protein